MKVAVIGDSCVDEFVYVESQRLAPDLPIPVVVEKYRAVNPGMAANVERAIKFHGHQTKLFAPPGWEEVKKTRIVDDRTNHSFIRLDRPFGAAEFDLSTITFCDFDAVVVSDYGKGFLTEQLIGEITEQHERVFLDSKRILGDWAAGAYLIKINEFEFRRSESGMSEALRQKVVCTLGGKGATYRGKNFPTEEVEVKDTSGAGDVFLARLVSEMLANDDPVSAIRLANESASAVVGMRGVGVA